MMKCVVLCLSAAVACSAECSTAGNVRLKGLLGERLETMIARQVVGVDVDYLTAPFLEKTERRYWWQTEFWGKWMHAAVPYCRYSGSEKLSASIDRGVGSILSSQEPCGYIGNYPVELRCDKGWDVWGFKYTMLGLMHYYDLTRTSDSPDVRRKGDSALEACAKLCDYVIGELGPGGRSGRELWETGNWSGYASSSILEPVVWLSRRMRARPENGSGERADKYLGFASFIVKGMTDPVEGPRLVDLALKGISVADRNGYGNKARADGRYVVRHNRRKAYEMLSCYQGILEYAREREEVSGADADTEKLRRAAMMTAEDILREEINLAGGCSSAEAWYHGASRQTMAYRRLQETCVTTTWMRFCARLLAETDDPKWADELEKTFYNAYLAALSPDGSAFASYTPLSGERSVGQDHCFMHVNCCKANGPRGFLAFLDNVFRVKDAQADICFYTSALLSGVCPGSGEKIAFDMYSLYPRSDSVRIVSHTEMDRKLKLRMRIPSWSAATEVKLNGEVLSGVRAGTYFAIEREWKLGDVVEIVFDMPVVSRVIGRHVAFTRGPVLLSRDSRFGDGDLGEQFRKGISDGQIQPSFKPVRTPHDGMWMAFSAVLPIGSHDENPEAKLPIAVGFCDYASAGNEWRRGNYYRSWFPIEIGPQEAQESGAGRCVCGRTLAVSISTQGDGK